MLKVSIVEDNKKNTKDLCDFLDVYQKEINEEIKCECFSDGAEFTEKYDCASDVVFMDIEMPFMNGLEASKILREKDKDVPLIFLTVMSQYAINGYDYDARSFLVKPVNYDLLRNQMNKILAERNRKKKIQKHMIINLGPQKEIMPYNDIIYIESFNHECFFSIDGRGDPIKQRTSLTQLEEQLKGCGFLRCSGSYLINGKYVISWTKNEVILKGNIKIPVGRAKKEQFFSELTTYLGEKL